jgi:uncharacterized protein YndB with AHSA1/START domain
MSTATSKVVRVTRKVRVSPDRLFRAFTTAADLERWYAPEGMTVPRVELDARVGGRFRIEMKAPDGTIHTAYGVITEFSPPHRLRHTWNWERHMDGEEGETVVTVEIRPDGEYSEVTLTHSGFATDSGAANHEKGWTSILDRLVKEYVR